MIELGKNIIGVMKTIGNLILPPKIYSKMVRVWYKRIRGKSWEVLAVKDWKDYLYDPRMDPILKKMMFSYENNQMEVMPSKYWEDLNRKNVTQLLEMGFNEKIGYNLIDAEGAGMLIVLRVDETRILGIGIAEDEDFETVIHKCQEIIKKVMKTK